MKYSPLCAAMVVTAMLTMVSAAPAQAATVTANLNVSATVIQICVLTGGSLAFGSYDPTSATSLDQAGSFQVACTRGSTLVTIGLGLGANASASQRRLTNATDFLNYEIYKEAGRTNVWGNAGAALVDYSPVTTSAAQTFQVFGRIPAGQTSVGVGASYTDTVVITVTF